MIPVTEENNVTPFTLESLTRAGTQQTDYHSCTNTRNTSGFHYNTKLTVSYLIDGGKLFLSVYQIARHRFQDVNPQLVVLTTDVYNSASISRLCIHK